jgi:hypothetical protein
VSTNGRLSNRFSAPITVSKNLSINNILVALDFSEGNYGRRKVIHSDKRVRKFLITYKQFSEPIEPAMRNFNNPTERFL